MFRSKCYDMNGNSINEFTQWDVNQEILIKIVPLDDESINKGYLTISQEVHFSNSKRDEALVVRASVVEDDTVKVSVPNILLTEPYPLSIYVYYSNSQNPSAQSTIVRTKIPVRKRNKPSDYDYVENIDRITADSLINEVKKEADKYINDIHAIVSEARKDMNFIGVNPIESKNNDSPERWAELGAGVAYINIEGCLINQPARQGFIENYVYGDCVKQIWHTQDYKGEIYKRAGDEGWYGSWSKVFDDSATIPVKNGGTGKTNHTINSILTGNNDGAVNNVTTANGALYADNTNGVARFGILPIAQGGTGASDRIAALNKLGISWGYGAPPEKGEPNTIYIQIN